MDLSHLHPAVRQAALLPADQRLAVIHADRWIGYPRANQALARLEALLAWPTRQRMPNMLLIGPTNNGKSMIIEKFRRAHPPTNPTENTSPCCAYRCRRTRHRNASTRPSWPRWVRLPTLATERRPTSGNRSPWTYSKRSACARW